MKRNVIYKYQLNQTETTVKMPKGSRILSCQIDQKTGNPAIWAMSSTSFLSELEEREFHLVMTGELILDHTPPDVFLGTVQMMNGAMIYHVFEILKH